MSFVEFFASGEYRIVWTEPQKSCTWNPTGRDIRGNTGVREIARHGGKGREASDV